VTNFGRSSRVDNYDREDMRVRIKSIPRYCQDSDNEESKDSGEEEKWRPKKKETKDHSEIIRRCVYCQNCYNERHLTKECKLLNKICQMVKIGEAMVRRIRIINITSMVIIKIIDFNITE
jgi:predicted nucleic acid binding AN1-type Zn finger protein